MKKTMKKKIALFAVAAILLTSGVAAAAQYEERNNYGSQQPLDGGNGFIQRFMNQIRDTLGICQGGCNLSTLTGTLTYDGTNFFIGDVEVHFGPSWYITSSMSAVDYDQDGQYELVIDEIQGLVGAEVSVEGHYQSDGWMSVFTINGETYREPGQPIWASQHEWRWRYRNGNDPNKP
jgi:hypothetical protein